MYFMANFGGYNEFFFKTASQTFGFTFIYLEYHKQPLKGKRFCKFFIFILYVLNTKTKFTEVYVFKPSFFHSDCGKMMAILVFAVYNHLQTKTKISTEAKISVFIIYLKGIGKYHFA